MKHRSKWQALLAVTLMAGLFSALHMTMPNPGSGPPLVLMVTAR